MQGGTPPFRQMAIFYGVGIAAAIVHYGTMIGLVELAGWRPVAATLVGYVTGGMPHTVSTAGSPIRRSAAMPKRAGVLPLSPVSVSCSPGR